MAFDPKQHLRQFTRNQKVGKDANGRDRYETITSDYLDVKWRLVWLREECPDAEIETEMVAHTDTFALFRARVTRPGKGAATGWGSETRADFGDFIEKAETKALGRALAALGYGAAFCEDYATGDAVVDSPVERQTPPRPAITAHALSGKPEPAPVNADLATTAQLTKLHAAATSNGWKPADVKRVMADLWGVESSKQLTKHQAGLLIDLIGDRLALSYDADGKARLGQPGPTSNAAAPLLELDDLEFDPAPVGSAT